MSMSHARLGEPACETLRCAYPVTKVFLDQDVPLRAISANLRPLMWGNATSHHQINLAI